MIDDVIINKIQIIERCLKRINDVYENNPENLLDFTKQDSIVLNIQRACEATIDIAMHICAKFKLGVPQNSREAFEFLIKNSIIDEKLGSRMKAMVGFRNIIVHDYQSIDLRILQSIIEKNLTDFLKFKDAVLNFIKRL
ncbi:type VII toxin-antitoxin system HepT family RNase toxin [Caldicellulosiruptor morganii]|uniref:DUF86 domain-containing protein n=1 Tax=Caldicellulosiruptor morganii TaxID=1387555 RepID=A0ABY7BQT7_9FIRM|nr:DUF86 domain-containing protein [Caldicellulosiruptor morganii]WAM34170.1 DUF86 domain-containing protein [Caldicellulosiruptor morganii]